MCFTPFFMEIKIKEYYNQRNSVGADRENEAWPVKKKNIYIYIYDHFLTALNTFKTERGLHHCLTT